MCIRDSDSAEVEQWTPVVQMSSSRVAVRNGRLVEALEATTSHQEQVLALGRLLSVNLWRWKLVAHNRWQDRLLLLDVELESAV